MRLEDLTVEVRDKDLVRVGVIRPEELDLRMEDRFNNVGVWTLKLADEHPMVPFLKEPGAGIIVTGPTGVLLSGPTTKPEFQATPEDPMGTITFDGVTDTVCLSDALSYPQPSNANVTTQTEAHDVRTGPAETLMHQYVKVNIGPSAPVARRKANLILGTNGARGPTLTKRPRFPVLGNLLTEIAVTAQLGFRVVQEDDKLVFETYQVTDRSSYIRLDVANDTLAGSRLAVSAPTATRVIVAGQGEQVDRTFRQVDTTESIAAEGDWGRRIERFLDQRNTDVASELDQAGLEVLAEEGFTAVAVQAVPVDDSEGTMRYGIDWGLGDLVTVVVGSTEYVSTVTGTLIQVSPTDGFKVGVILGDPDQFDPQSALSGRVTDTARRVSELERNLETTNDLAAVIDDHINDTTGAHAASAISFTPTGNVAATTVQAAIAEVDSETDARLDALEAPSSIRLGSAASLNVYADNNEVSAFNNGATSTLNLNPTGGTVQVGGSGNNVGVVTVGNTGLGVYTTLNINQLQAFAAGGAASQLYLNYSNSGPIALGNNSLVTVYGASGRLVIENSSVGAGPASTGHPFQIGATSGQNVRIDQNEIMAVNNGAASGISINSGGGGVSMGANLSVATSLTVGTSVTFSGVGTNGTANVNITSAGVISRASSSLKYKENVRDLEWDVDQLLSLVPRIYQRNDHTKRVPIPTTDVAAEQWEILTLPVTEDTPWSPGFIAEEARDLGLSHWLTYWGDELDGFDYQAWTAAQQVVLRQHHQRVADLEAKNADLEARLAALEARLND